jgi:hypothetical protein
MLLCDAVLQAVTGQWPPVSPPLSPVFTGVGTKKPYIYCILTVFYQHLASDIPQQMWDRMRVEKWTVHQFLNQSGV